MLKKLIFAALLAIGTCLSFPASTYASDLSVDLVASMDSVCDISIGNNLELLRRAYTQPPYTQQWYPRYKADENMKRHLIYSHLLNNDAEAGYDLHRVLFVDADANGTINQIKYKLLYRTGGIYYRSMVNALTKNAAAKFGAASESTGTADGRPAQYKTWKSGNRQLTLVTYDIPANKDHPFVIEVIRS